MDFEPKGPAGPFFMRINDQPIWTPFVSLALAAAWLLPNAHPPWVAFHKDAFMAFVLLVTSCVVMLCGWRSRAESRWDLLSAYFVGLAILTAFQWMFGVIEFAGKAFLGLSYFLAAGWAIYVGRFWATWSPGHVERFLFPSFVVAGLLTAGIVYGQWAQVDMHPVWFSFLPPGERPYGNLNQANNAGSLLLLSLISMAWLMLRRGVGLGVFLLSAAFLIGAIILTASRITFISLVSLLVAATYFSWRRQGLRAYKGVPIVLLLIFCSIFLAQQYGWGDAVENSNPLRRDLTGVRMLAYRAFGEAIWAGPIWGFGFDQAVAAQLFSGNSGHKLPGLFGWTHNFILDIAVWFGWPVALVGVVLGGWSIFRVRRLKIDSSVAASIACIIVLLLHGMVELPLAYAYFLLPFCLLVGAIFSRSTIPAIKLGGAIAWAWLIGLVILLWALWSDYLRVEAAFNEWRFKAARIGLIPEKIVVDVRTLDQFSVLIEGLDADPAKPINIDVERFRSAVLLFPSPYALQRLVLLQVKTGDTEAARKSIEITRLLTVSETNRDMAAQWRAWQKMDPDLARVQWGTD